MADDGKVERKPIGRDVVPQNRSGRPEETAGVVPRDIIRIPDPPPEEGGTEKK